MNHFIPLISYKGNRGMKKREVGQILVLSSKFKVKKTKYIN